MRKSFRTAHVRAASTGVARGCDGHADSGMSLAILEAGAPPPELLAKHGHYPAMFERLLGIEATTYEVRAGELPRDVSRHSAYLITGSSADAYEDLPWIGPLMTFLRAAKGKARLVGICFGHQ